MTQLYFSNNLKERQFKLIEISQDLLDQIKKTGVHIKGRENEPVVLCTPNMTFELKQVEVSNTVLILENVPGTTEKEIIHSVVSSQLEVKPTAPKLSHLKVLMKTQILDPNDTDGTELIYTTSNLLPLIQASQVELMKGLVDLGAFQFNCKWCLLSVGAEFDILEELTTMVRAEGWDFDGVPLSECEQKMIKSHPKEVIQHCLNSYFTKTNGIEKFNGHKYCLTCAVYLFEKKDLEL